MTEINPHPVVQLSPLINGILADTNNQIDTLLQIRAPACKRAEKRPPLNLAIVLDRSGSMCGEPLNQAKRCAKYFVSQLQATDRIAIIAYDHRATTLLKCEPVGNHFRAIDAIDSIQEGGMTNLHLGWQTGVNELQPSVTPDTISRVLLLSDGCANQGLTDPEQIAEACRRASMASISTSTYGLGWHFNEDLMALMAQSSEGQAYFGETAEDLFEPFQQEFDLLSSLYARRVRLALDCAPGIQAEVLNSYVGGKQKNLPDLAHDAEIWALVRFHVPKIATGSGTGEILRIGEIRISGINLEGHPLDIGSVECVLPSLELNAHKALTENQLVRRRLGEVLAADLQSQAREAARQGRWDKVEQLLAQARELAADNPWVEAIIDHLERLAREKDQGRFSKEARYSSLKLSTRYATVNEGIDDLAIDPTEKSFARRKRQQGKGSGKEQA